MTNQQYSCCVCICKRGFKCVYVGLFSSVARQCRKSQKQPVIRSKNRKYLQLKPSILTIATRIPTPLESFYGHRNGHCTILIPLLFGLSRTLSLSFFLDAIAKITPEHRTLTIKLQIQISLYALQTPPKKV